MAEDTQDVNNPDGQTQEVATSATEQQVPAETPVAEETPKQESDELGLPEDASERTRQRVQEVLEENKKLKAQVETPRVQVNTTQVAQAGAPPKADEFGNINPNYLEWLEQRAVGAEARANQALQTVSASEDQRQTREALTAHPELQTRPALVKTARALMMDSLVYPESYNGQPLTYKGAVDYLKGNVVGQPKESPQQVQERITAKEQASLVAEGRPSQGVAKQLSDDELHDLQVRTRKGDAQAAVARLKNIPAE